MSFQLFFQLFKSRLWLIAFIMLITVVTATVLSLLKTKQYTATSSLVLTFQTSSPFDQRGIPVQLDTSYMATQQDIIVSHKVALKVVDHLKLYEKPSVRDDFMNDTNGRGDIRDWLADKLLVDLSVQPSRDSRVVSLSYTATDPDYAAKITNAFAQAYIDATLELSMEPARRNAVWFNNQLVTLRARLEEEQNRLTSYQQEKGIVATDERLDTETRRLEELSSSLVKAQADVFDVKSRQLGWQHPEFKRAIEQEASLRKALESQKAKVLDLKQQRDELDLLVREVANTQSTYDAGLKRYNQSSLESQFNQTNISVLNEAVPPIDPSSPKLLLNLALSIFLGLVFSLGLMLMLEVFNRKIRVENDITDGLGLPLLASL